jgi:predicted negative regulator of RcsB-dependent stress response
VGLIQKYFLIDLTSKRGSILAQDKTPENKRMPKALRNADQFQRSMIEGFQWTTSHSKIVIGLVVAFVVLAGGFSLAQYQQMKTETQVQEKYFVLEKQYMEKKSGFDQADQAKLKKDTPTDKANKKAPTPVAATGDLQKDYGDIPASFESLVKEFPKSRGAQMSALNLSEIYLQYKKPEEALRALNAVSGNLGSSEMLSALVLSQLGSVYADQNNCKDAVQQWEKIVNNKSLRFAHDEAKIRMGICYESLNDLTKAEQLYTEVSKKDDANGDFGASRDAEKYLRLLKMKKNMTGTGS